MRQVTKLQPDRYTTLTTAAVTLTRASTRNHNNNFPKNIPTGNSVGIITHRGTLGVTPSSWKCLGDADLVLTPPLSWRTDAWQTIWFSTACVSPSQEAPTGKFVGQSGSMTKSQDHHSGSVHFSMSATVLCLYTGSAQRRTSGQMSH